MEKCNGVGSGNSTQLKYSHDQPWVGARIMDRALGINPDRNHRMISKTRNISNSAGSERKTKSSRSQIYRRVSVAQAMPH